MGSIGKARGSEESTQSVTGHVGNQGGVSGHSKISLKA